MAHGRSSKPKPPATDGIAELLVACRWILQGLINPESAYTVYEAEQGAGRKQAKHYDYSESVTLASLVNDSVIVDRWLLRRRIDTA